MRGTRPRRRALRHGNPPAGEVTSDQPHERLETARDRHQARSPGRRLLVLAGGWAAVALGILVVVPLPELGILLLLVGLRLLALRYEWAARAYVPVARLWEWFKALATSTKIGLGLAVAAIVVAIVLWQS